MVYIVIWSCEFDNSQPANRFSVSGAVNGAIHQKYWFFTREPPNSPTLTLRGPILGWQDTVYWSHGWWWSNCLSFANSVSTSNEPQGLLASVTTSVELGRPYWGEEMHWTSEHLQPILTWLLFEWNLRGEGEGRLICRYSSFTPSPSTHRYLQPVSFHLEAKETNIYWVGTRGWLVVVRNYCILVIHSFIPVLVMERQTRFLPPWRIRSRGDDGVMWRRTKWSKQVEEQDNPRQWGCFEDGHRELWWRGGLSLYTGGELSPAEQDPGEQNTGEDTWEVCRKAFQVEGTS